MVDVSKYQFCSNPNIWVFDGLLSESLLNYIDEQCDSNAVRQHTKDTNDENRVVYVTTVPVDNITRELTDVLTAISHIDNVAPCCKMWIRDVSGEDQNVHMDRIDVKALRDPDPQKLGFIDVSKFSYFETEHRIIPTLSFVIYFNDVGSCIFPHVQKSIASKRGRILMFQNYIDSQRPACNLAVEHHGAYAKGMKRVMTGGMLSNETPQTLLGLPAAQGHRTIGAIYCPNGHDWREPHGHGGAPAPAPAPPPRPVTPLPKYEWWWLQGEHRVPVQVIQWKMYEPEKCAILSASYEEMARAGQREGMVCDMSPAPFQVRRAQSVTIANENVPDRLGERCIAGHSAYYWNLPPSQWPPSPLLKAGQGSIIEGFYQVRTDDVDLMEHLGTFLADSSNPEWPYPERPFPNFPRRRVVLLIERTEEAGPIPTAPDSPEVAAKKRQAEQVFQTYNSSGNGKMSRAELEQMLRLVDPNWPDAAIANTFSSVDSNSNGSIEVDEFTRWALTPESVGSVILALHAD